MNTISKQSKISTSNYCDSDIELEASKAVKLLHVGGTSLTLRDHVVKTAILIETYLN